MTVTTSPLVANRLLREAQELIAPVEAFLTDKARCTRGHPLIAVDFQTGEVRLLLTRHGTDVRGEPRLICARCNQRSVKLANGNGQGQREGAVA